MRWLPTGPLALLPLHAAGHPGDPARSVLDLVTSSYAVTLEDPVPTPAGNGFHSLVVAVPCAAGVSVLPHAEAEAADVASLLSPPVIALTGDTATRARVLAELGGSSWAHLACHADSATNPGDSHLALTDGRLPVRELIRIRANGYLAFLSACATAFAGTSLPDEALHIVSAMRLAGFRHVIGTLWRIDDAVARVVAARVYRDPALRHPAEALRNAMLALRTEYPAAPLLWAAHIHVG